MNSAECKVQSAKSKVRFSVSHSALSTQHLVAASLLAAMLSGCGTPATRPGGYYLDDGPGGKPPANLDSIPDAVPRVEPINRGTARPYVVMGRSYTPMTSLAPYKARGIATWYGRRYHGKQTASGERYDMYAMTAAHTTLPIPSYARVTNLANGKSVVVRINDRGPFVDGRIIDLSYTAAHKLGVLAGGNARVEVEALVPARG
jgi:rare lipoprotein A